MSVFGQVFTFVFLKIYVIETFHEPYNKLCLHNIADEYLATVYKNEACI